MKLVSWNVNGLRSCLTKGFLEYVKQEDPDIVCLQETKLQPEQAVFDLPGYHRYFNSADKKGYSGTAILTKTEPLSVTYDSAPTNTATKDGSSRRSTRPFTWCAATPPTARMGSGAFPTGCSGRTTCGSTYGSWTGKSPWCTAAT